MRTDPRAACKNENERALWAFVHDGLAHPLMAITLWSRWTLRFHDWTSRKAWPRRDLKGFYTFKHPRIDHTVTVKARNKEDAADQAREWFKSLRDVGIDY